MDNNREITKMYSYHSCNPSLLLNRFGFAVIINTLSKSSKSGKSGKGYRSRICSATLCHSCHSLPLLPLLRRRDLDRCQPVSARKGGRQGGVKPSPVLR